MDGVTGVIHIVEYNVLVGQTQILQVFSSKKMNNNGKKRVYAQFFTGDDTSGAHHDRSSDTPSPPASKSAKLSSPSDGDGVVNKTAPSCFEIALSLDDSDGWISGSVDGDQSSLSGNVKRKSISKAAEGDDDDDLMYLVLDEGNDVKTERGSNGGIQVEQNEPSMSQKSVNVPTVRPIDQKSIHRICSGQVITCMSDAVKELIENSLDAGANVIEVVFKDDGISSIQVSDNGTGISRENYETVVQKHCTSKISCFEDIERVTSFGFRGEALSSLCAISDMSILTRTRRESLGTFLSFDHNNNMLECKLDSMARDVGTTVTVQNIFKNYPVRFIQLKKNLKREYTKCLNVIEQYCLMSDGLRLSCYSHDLSSRNKKLVMQTKGTCLRDNIAGVLGGTMFKKLQEVDSQSDIVQIKGYISKVDVGSGRSSADRQYLYLNSRPVDIPKISKMINIIYKQFNLTQYPIYVLNIIVRPDSYDVNVTPDKRTVYLENELHVISFIKDVLETLYDSSSRSLTRQNNISLIDNSPVPFEKDEIERIFAMKRESQLSSHSSQNDSVSSSSPLSQSNSVEDTTDILHGRSMNDVQTTDRTRATTGQASSSTRFTIPKLIKTSKASTTSKSSTNKSLTSFLTRTEKKEKPCSQFCHHHHDDSDCEAEDENEDESTKSSSHAAPLSQETSEACESDEDDELETVEVIYDDQIERRVNTQEPIVLTASTSSIIGAYQKSRHNLHECTSSSSQSTRRFLNLGIHPNNGKDCEEELSKQLSKQDFLKMQIIGQFNKGFIIAKLDNDLFIIDQHASDEKYNFEQLKTNTRMNTQPLIIPKNLELSATDEMVIMDNLEVFEKNGFRFQIDHDAPVSERVKLLAVPHSKSVVFNENDVHEMIFMLHEFNPELITIRPSKITSIFASRACRKSIMIGKTLSLADMKRVVSNMSTMEQPWNCPHGRPTIRHMIDLKRIKQGQSIQQRLQSNAT